MDTDEFPLRENCDPEVPEECFLWMLVALPQGKAGAPLIMPVEYLRLISKRLWECGARPAAAPIIKYRAPSGSRPHWMMSPGSWVPVDTPDPPKNPTQDMWDRLTMQQKEELRAIVEAQVAKAMNSD